MGTIYLIKHNSNYLLNKKINELTEGIIDVFKINLDEVEIKDSLEESLYTSLFNEKKAIIFNNTKYFGGKFLYEEDMEVVKNLLSNLDDNIDVLFICNELSKTKDNTKDVLALGANIIDLTYNNDDLIEIIHGYLSNNNIVMDDNTINELLQRVNNNLDIFISEVEKISNIDTTITVELLDEYCAYNEVDNTFNFSNAIIDKNFKDGFDLLDDLLDKGAEVQGLIGLLASSYTQLYVVKDALANGLSDTDIVSMMNISPGALYYKKKSAGIYTLDEIKEIIINLSTIDKKIKTGSDPVYMLKEFLLSI